MARGRAVHHGRGAVPAGLVRHRGAAAEGARGAGRGGPAHLRGRPAGRRPVPHRAAHSRFPAPARPVPPRPPRGPGVSGPGGAAGGVAADAFRAVPGHRDRGRRGRGAGRGPGPPGPLPRGPGGGAVRRRAPAPRGGPGSRDPGVRLRAGAAGGLRPPPARAGPRRAHRLERGGLRPARPGGALPRPRPALPPWTLRRGGRLPAGHRGPGQPGGGAGAAGVGRRAHRARGTGALRGLHPGDRGRDRAGLRQTDRGGPGGEPAARPSAAWPGRTRRSSAATACRTRAWCRRSSTRPG